MIKPVEYNGYLWKVTFQYTPDKKACAAQGGPNITHCMILPNEVPDGGIIDVGIKAGVGMLVGAAQRSATDKPSYEIGRKLSMARALKGAPKDFRRAVWQAYLGRKKPKPTEQEEWAQGMVRLRDQIRSLEWQIEDMAATQARLGEVKAKIEGGQ